MPAITNADASGCGTATIALTVTKDDGGTITSATANIQITVSGFPAGTDGDRRAYPQRGARVSMPAIYVSAGLASGELTLTNGGGSMTKNGINVPSDRAAAILANPAGHYFNVHTVLNPAGAIRGQLAGGGATLDPGSRFRTRADWFHHGLQSSSPICAFARLGTTSLPQLRTIAGVDRVPGHLCATVTAQEEAQTATASAFVPPRFVEVQHRSFAAEDLVGSARPAQRRSSRDTLENGAIIGAVVGAAGLGALAALICNAYQEEGGASCLRDTLRGAAIGAAIGIGAGVAVDAAFTRHAGVTVRIGVTF